MKLMTAAQLCLIQDELLVAPLLELEPSTKAGNLVEGGRMCFGDLKIRLGSKSLYGGRVPDRFSEFANVETLYRDSVGHLLNPCEREDGSFVFNEHRPEVWGAEDAIAPLLESGESFALERERLDLNTRDHLSAGDVFVVFEPDDIRAMIARLNAVLEKTANI